MGFECGFGAARRSAAGDGDRVFIVFKSGSFDRAAKNEPFCDGRAFGGDVFFECLAWHFLSDGGLCRAGLYQRDGDFAYFTKMTAVARADCHFFKTNVWSYPPIVDKMSEKVDNLSDLWTECGQIADKLTKMWIKKKMFIKN